MADSTDGKEKGFTLTPDDAGSSLNFELNTNERAISASDVAKWLNNNRDKLAFVETGRVTSELKNCIYDSSQDALLILTKPVKM